MTTIQFILGSPGTGKTSYCLQEINRLIDGNAPLYYLVPEQFSLQSEKLLLTSRTAATRVQVLSFNRLAYRLFAMLGGPPGKLADDLGKQMLLRKVLLETESELTYYKSAVDKHGFVNSLADTITEMNHYRVSTTDLRLRAENLPPALAAKLNDMALLLEKYRETVTGRYLLTDDMLELLCQKLEHEPDANPLLDGTHFWVDGFSGFTPQERHVLLHIAKRAKSLSITLTTRDRKNYTDPLSAPARETIEKLTSLAKKKRIAIQPHIYMEKNHRHPVESELAHFVQNFEVGKSLALYDKQNFSTENSIEIISASDRYASVYSAADYILRLVREGGCRFRDIAILCGDRLHYEKILQTTFDRLNIPLFVDTETDILSHPLTELIRAALDIVVRNWNYESVFRFLKTRLTGMDSHTMDVLENYVLEHGISSFRWRYQFKNPIAEDGRQQLLKFLEIFGKVKSDSKATVQNHCRRVFDMLYALKVPETLQAWFDMHIENGDPATARLHKQIWPKCCEIFDKLVQILGDEKIDTITFASILDAGFAQVGLGHIPPTTNQVILGDMGRSRYPEIKAMIVLGANENILPPLPTQNGLFTDHERQMLRNTDLELSPENLRRINENYYSLYCALSQPSQKLIFIYAESEPGGNKLLRPSPIIKKLLEIFPELSSTPAPAFMEYGAIESPQIPENLSPESASSLYGKTLTTAASRLESYALCPFAYYMHYVLKARERKQYEVLSADLGTLFHNVFAAFSKQVWESGDSCSNISQDELSDVVNQIVSSLTIDENIYHDTARNRYILDKARRISIQSIRALCEHINRGEFVPTYSEHEIKMKQAINLKNNRRLILTGIVDRIDILTTPDEEYLKIIDYKSGQTKFSIDEVRAGVQLQLMLYMNVLTSAAISGKKIKPGGVFYFPVGDPLLKTDVVLDDHAREEGLLRQYKMSGVAISDEISIKGMDTTLAPGTESVIIPVGINNDSRYKKTAHPMSAENFCQLGQEVENKIIELGERMISGDITANPFSSPQKSPCRFCNFGAVCKF